MAELAAKKKTGEKDKEEKKKGEESEKASR